MLKNFRRVKFAWQFARKYSYGFSPHLPQGQKRAPKFKIQLLFIRRRNRNWSLFVVPKEQIIRIKVEISWCERIWDLY